MGRQGVSLDEVAAAAQSLVGQNINPTQERIRLLLGGGSFSTIAKYLRMWREQRQRQEHENLAELKPPDAVQSAVKEVWQQIHEASCAQIEEIKQQAEEQVRHAEEVSQKLTKQIEEESAKNSLALEALRHEKEELKRTLQQSQDALNACQNELQQTRAAQHQSQRELQDVQQRHSVLVAQLQQQLRDQHEQHACAFAAHQETTQSSMKELLQAHRRDNQEHAAQRSAWQQEQDLLRHRYASMATKYQVVCARLKKLRKRSQERHGRWQQQWQEYHDVCQERDRLSLKLAAAEQGQALSEQLVAVAQQHHAALLALKDETSTLAHSMVAKMREAWDMVERPQRGNLQGAEKMKSNKVR